jgi:hypothetical protein
MAFARPARTLSALVGSMALAGAFVITGAAAASAAPNTLRVGCGQGSYPSITAAVAAAASGDTVVVCPGPTAGG